MLLNEDLQNAKQDIASALEYFFTQKIMHINTVLPAKILEVNGSRASVQPLIDCVLFDGKIEPRPKIQEVPIFQQTSKSFGVFVPVEKNDIGILLVFQRDISEFKSSLAQKPPPSKRAFSLADAIFIPMSSFAKSFKPKNAKAICIEDFSSGDSIVLGGGKLTIETKTCEIKATEAIIDAQIATIKASKIDLGGPGGLGVARIGDTVATPVGNGTILGGSTSVFAK